MDRLILYQYQKITNIAVHRQIVREMRSTFFWTSMGQGCDWKKAGMEENVKVCLLRHNITGTLSGYPNYLPNIGLKMVHSIKENKCITFEMNSQYWGVITFELEKISTNGFHNYLIPLHSYLFGSERIVWMACLTVKKPEIRLLVELSHP
jgi:hypothetical protein